MNSNKQSPDPACLNVMLYSKPKMSAQAFLNWYYDYTGDYSEGCRELQKIAPIVRKFRHKEKLR